VIFGFEGGERSEVGRGGGGREDGEDGSEIVLLEA